MLRKPTDLFQGVSFEELANRFGTPLYLYDESLIRSQCQLFQTTFQHPRVPSEVLYASKAFLTKAMVRLIQEEGLSLDVVSGGELYTALQVGFPAQHIFFHGNNKSQTELQEALDAHVGTMIVDHATELELLVSLLPPASKQRVMLRVNPGIEAHTHEYIKTTKNDSKFGVSIYQKQTLELIQAMASHPNIDFVGLHSHIGSQIFEESSFLEHSKVLLNFVKQILTETQVVIKEINLGGGFGVRYTAEDHVFPLSPLLETLLDTVYQESLRLNIAIPKVLIEPGRAIVGEAGCTLYQVGSTKQTINGKNYLMVDGSMADHIRTALYQAKYDASLLSHRDINKTLSYTVAGKACESGDIIIHSITLPEAQRGDYLLVYSTGAYHYSMSSNYNRLTRPAVVFVKDGTARTVVRKETYTDVLQNDIDEVE